MWPIYSIFDLLQLVYGDDDGDNLVDGYVVANLKKDRVHLETERK